MANIYGFIGCVLWCFGSWTASAQGVIRQPGQIQQPGGNWQKPGEIQVPKGNWQKPGDIQVPRGIQAVGVHTEPCAQRLAVVADALFDFNQWTLTAQAEETLNALRPLLAKAGNHPISVEGHTDAVGSATYNQKLSLKRAQTVKDWLVAHQLASVKASVAGYGETRPVAPNTKADGTDNPEGRQKNRRVELVIDTCK